MFDKSKIAEMLAIKTAYIKATNNLDLTLLLSFYCYILCLS